MSALRHLITAQSKTTSLCLLLVGIWSCSGDSDNTSDNNTTASPGSQVNSTETWLINSTASQSEFIFDSASNQGVVTNIQTVVDESNNGIDYLRVVSAGIPNYQVTMTQQLHDQLSSRPLASIEFINGMPTILIGEVIEFGQNLGFTPSAINCNETGGAGYWPPASECPRSTKKSALFRKSPQPSSERCDTAEGAIGYLSNGTSLYGWTAGSSFQNAGIWRDNAVRIENLALDICQGHAQADDYHHHSWSSCLAEQLQDNGDRHSPVYGIAADGYLIYGPWHSAGTLAASAWVSRDYDSPDSATGCGNTGERSCLLVDQLDASKGTSPAVSNGPRTDATITLPSGHSISAESGLYFEDYYYNPELTALAGRYLDQHNGHAHDGSAYHYHLTAVESAEGLLNPVFPYSVGPSYYGVLDNNSVARCAGATAGLAEATQ